MTDTPQFCFNCIAYSLNLMNVRADCISSIILLYNGRFKPNSDFHIVKIPVYNYTCTLCFLNIIWFVFNRFFSNCLLHISSSNLSYFFFQIIPCYAKIQKSTIISHMFISKIRKKLQSKIFLLKFKVWIKNIWSIKKSQSWY